jgi:hypothetical protein
MAQGLPLNRTGISYSLSCIQLANAEYDIITTEEGRSHCDELNPKLRTQ